MNWKRVFMLLGILVLGFGLVACGAAEEGDPFADPGVEEPLGEDPLGEEPLDEEPLGEEPLEEEEPVGEEPLEEDPLAGEAEEPMAGEEMTPFAEFDEDDDALLSEDEFNTFLADNEMGFDEADATLFSEFDEDQDQFLSEDEFNTFTAEAEGLDEGMAAEEGEDVVAEEEGEDIAEDQQDDDLAMGEEDTLGTTILSDELIGAEIAADFAADAATAEIEEVLIDSQGMIQYVVFDAGGWLEMDERVVAVRWDMLQMHDQAQMAQSDQMMGAGLTFTGTAQDLEAAPEIDLAALDEPDLAIDATTMNMASEFDDLLQVGEFAEWDLLQDWELVNANDEDLGVIDQLVLHLPESQATYVVADVGGFLGVEEKETAIPWRLVQLDMAEQQFTVPVEQVAIEDAPEFDEAMFDDDTMLAEDWDAEISAYWEGIQPIEAAELDE